MKTESSPNDLFRFVQLRPPVSLDSSQFIELIATTALFQQMQSSSTVGERQAAADTFINAHTGDGVFIRKPEDLAIGAAVLSAISTTTAASKPTVNLFVSTLLSLLKLSTVGDVVNNQRFQSDREYLSDTLLARIYTSYLLPNLEILQHIYRMYHLLVRLAAGETVDLSWERLLRLSIVIPENALPSPSSLRRAQSPLAARADIVAEKDESSTEEWDRLYRAYRELMRYDAPEHIVQPPSPQDNETHANVFALQSKTIERLAADTRRVVEERGIALESTPIHAVIMALYTALQQEQSFTSPAPHTYGQQAMIRASAQSLAADRTVEDGTVRKEVRPSGVGNLLVVKQQIKRYEPAEIAHIENVLAGEAKSRELRELQQIEETFSNVVETTREEQNELETAQRFELNQETSRTIQQDQKVNFGVNLSGKYGPYVEFSSNFALETSQSVEETNSNSSNYAQDIVKRSLERIVEHIREERTRRILREVEEKNLHALTNTTAEHIRGVYQFVDKIYEAQVFDYGIRMMYDFMVPEPASYLHYLRSKPEHALELPQPPPKFTLTSHTELTEFNYGTHVSTYGATDIDPAPEPYVLASINVSNQGDDESGEPRFAKTEKLTIPKGYGPERVEYAAQATTDEDMDITVLVGARFHRIDRSEGTSFPPFPQLMSLNQGAYSYPDGTQLAIGVFVRESRSFIVDLTIFCKRRPEAFEQWQLHTYQKIQQAYERRVSDYEEKVASIKAEEAQAQAEADQQTSFGDPPPINRVTERNELKKHVIAIVTGSRYEDIDAMQDGDPPYFDFEEARKEGSFIRFFEQSFEWDQMQYVFYPYFWGRAKTWQDRFITDDPDPQFREFLKAGAARVVVSVRPGFETALQHYLDTGKLWDGQGDPPQITSPLYVSIVEEIKERTGASQGEMPVGAAWDVRVPTNLLYVRSNDDLPAWQQNPAGSWQWEPVPTDLDAAQSVVALLLVDANAKKTIMQLSDEAVIYLEDLPAKITVQAVTRPEYVGSVGFNLNNEQQLRVRNNNPYLLYGDDDSESGYSGVAPKAGDYILSVMTFSGPKGLGVASPVMTIRYSFKKKPTSVR